MEKCLQVTWLKNQKSLHAHRYVNFNVSKRLHLNLLWGLNIYLNAVNRGLFICEASKSKLSRQIKIFLFVIRWCLWVLPSTSRQVFDNRNFVYCVTFIVTINLLLAFCFILHLWAFQIKAFQGLWRVEWKFPTLIAFPWQQHSQTSFQWDLANFILLLLSVWIN